MSKMGSMVLVILAILARSGDADPASAPADFKIKVASYSLQKDPIYTEDIIFYQGKSYIFASHNKEVVIIESADSRVEMLDVGRKIQTEVTFKTLDSTLEKVRETLREAASEREKMGGKANAVEAKITRDLFETKLTVTHESKRNRVRLTNPAVEIDADGEPETDASRIAQVTATLGTVAKLGTLRSPSDLPPFSELEAIASLKEHKLMPTELTYLYRLTGPPRKFHRTYRLVPELTEREVEAISRINRLREVVPSVRYEKYRLDR